MSIEQESFNTKIEHTTHANELLSPERPFKQEDAEFIVENLTKYPNQSIYNIISGKIVTQKDTKELLNYSYSLIEPQLEAIAQLSNSNIETFKGGEWIDRDGLRHKFTNPNDLQIDSWFYYSAKRLDDENYYSHEEITTRVYLHPTVAHWFETWIDILKLLEKDPIIREVGYQSKVPNFYKITSLDTFAQMKNQHDRILIYFGDKGKKIGINIIKKYVSEHSEFFQDTHSLAMPVYNNGLRLDGMNVASETDKILGTSFNDVHARIIESILHKVCEKYKKEDGTTPSVSELREKMINNTELQQYIQKYLVQKYPEELIKNGFEKNNTAILRKP
jgi:hypothetical protein